MRRPEDADSRCRLHGGSKTAADQSEGRPSFSRTSRGHPFHSATKVLPVYCRSSTPTLLDQKPEAVRVAEPVEERNALAVLGLGLLVPGDVVHHLEALRLRTIGKGLPETLPALEVQPGEAAAHRRLAMLAVPFGGQAVDHPVVHELRKEGVGGTAGMFVLRDDDVGQDVDRLPFVGREEPRR